MAITSLYIHVPFCRTRCHYCDFVTSAISGPVPEAYVEGLIREIEWKLDRLDRLATVFLGGGTPSLLTPTQLDRLLERLCRQPGLQPNAEITVEANPDDISKPLARAWRDLGINRVSIGVQSLDNRVLHYLGRRHDADRARVAMDIVAGLFGNWSVDLIFGALPRNTLERTLREIILRGPPHLSVYGLTWEPGTPLYSRLEEAPDEEAWLELYDTAETILTAAGWEHYEISSYARPGHQCRHNLVYWRNESYEGMGPAAWRFDGARREKNPDTLHKWLERPGEPEESEMLSDFDIRVETVIQHVRLAAGINGQAYRNRFGSTLAMDFGTALRHCEAEGLLVPVTENAGWQPTPKGFRLNNRIGLLLLECRPTGCNRDSINANRLAVS